ncbi:hypothetical protein EW026_g3548 [Hermanssonia centrifuga]|uniref:DUF6534 domain-containing protein n=1 Tax=Hermanssonia centrifuga TaxID=98765 RepID=A0A4S4KKU1_9APHY|nr:hypothetical protein EW026_g3548 [Hermanssonia centrifuga]
MIRFLIVLTEFTRSIATIASLVCWLVMPHNLVYLGLHFMISKLYANSLLASLNARKTLRQVHSSIVEGSVRPGFRASLQPGSPGPFSAFSMRSEKKMTNTKLEISVQRTIDCVTIDEEMRYTPSPSPSPSFVADRDEHKHSEYA